MGANDRAAFHAERQQGLGGSDVAVIFGLSPWKTPFELWQEKTGRVTPDADSLQIRFGQFAEQFGAEEYARVTGRRVQRFNAMLRHPAAPLVGHVDRLVIPEGAKIAALKGEIRTDRGLEIKTASAFALGRDSEWGEAGTDLMPSHYLMQCATYMALTGCPHWDLAVLFGNQAFRVYHLRRDLELESMIVEAATDWWETYVLTDTPPDPSTAEEARYRWPMHAAGSTVEVPETIGAAIRELIATKERIRQLEAEEKRLRDLVIPAMADGDTIVCGGQKLGTYRANKPSTVIDWQAIARQCDPCQALIDGHTTTKPGARVLRLSKELTHD